MADVIFTKGGLKSQAPSITKKQFVEKITDTQQSNLRNVTESAKTKANSRNNNRTPTPQEVATMNTITPQNLPTSSMDSSFINAVQQAKFQSQQSRIKPLDVVKPRDGINQGTRTNLAPTINTPPVIPSPYIEKSVKETIRSGGRDIPYVEFTYVKPGIGQAERRGATYEEVAAYQDAERALTSDNVSSEKITKLGLSLRGLKNTISDLNYGQKAIRDQASVLLTSSLGTSENQLLSQQNYVITSTGNLKRQSQLIEKNLLNQGYNPTIAKIGKYAGIVGSELIGLSGGAFGGTTQKTLKDPIKELVFKPIALTSTGYAFGYVATGIPLVARELGGRIAGDVAKGIVGSTGAILGTSYAASKGVEYFMAPNVYERGSIIGSTVEESALLGVGAKAGSSTATDYYGSKIKVVAERKVKDPLAIVNIQNKVVNGKDVMVGKVNVKVETQPPRIKLMTSKFREQILGRSPIIIERLKPTYRQINSLEPIYSEKKYLVGESKAGLVKRRVLNLYSNVGKGKQVFPSSDVLSKTDLFLSSKISGGKVMKGLSVFSDKNIYEKGISSSKYLGKVSKGKLIVESNLLDYPLRAGKLRIKPGVSSPVISRSFAEINEPFIIEPSRIISKGRLASMIIGRDNSLRVKKGGVNTIDLFIQKNIPIVEDLSFVKGSRLGVGTKKTPFTMSGNNLLSQQDKTFTTEILSKLPKINKGSTQNIKVINNPSSSTLGVTSSYSGLGLYERGNSGSSSFDKSIFMVPTVPSIDSVMRPSVVERQEDSVINDLSSGSSGRNRGGSRSPTRLRDETLVSQIPINIIDNKPNQGSRQNSEQRSIQRLIGLNINNNPNIIPIPRIVEKEKRPPRVPKLFGSYSTKAGGGRYTVFTRRKGKFSPIAYTSDLDKAFSIGSSKALNTLARTFTVKGLKGNNFRTPKGFYSKSSKKYGTLFIQKSKSSLSSAGEKSEISAMRRLLR